MIKNLYILGLCLNLVLSTPIKAQQDDAPNERRAPAQATQQSKEINTTKAKCDALANKERSKSLPPGQVQAPLTADETKELLVCKVFKGFSPNETIANVEANENKVYSTDKKIMCKKTASFTVDYDPCGTALGYYNHVLNAEVAMDLQQKVRTEVKNQNIQKDATQKAVSGDIQTGMFDAAIESNKHQKNMQQEKLVVYGAAVAALVSAYKMIPDKDGFLKKCTQEKKNPKEACEAALSEKGSSILSNKDAKAALAMAITTFMAKATAAGIAMGQYNNAANQVEAVKKTVTNDGDDLMVERCAFNPADPACAKAPTTRTPGQIFAPGSFGDDSAIGNNAFNLNPDSDATIDPALDPSTGENSPIAKMNSPFVDEAKKAKEIVDPAGAAQTQAGTAPSGGGGGGGAGGGGAGGASLGSDVGGADKDGNKEAMVKASEASATYAQGGAGGYRGVSGGRADPPNPFANLFDAKSAGGVIEESSVPDIDGAASGLFQKISRRYGQMQADKRIEAKNLE